jgi:predicted DNA-binding transcriptional regulator AlpA
MNKSSTEEDVRQIVRDELTALLAPVFEKLGLRIIDDNYSPEFLTNKEARLLLSMDHDTMLDRIKSGDFVEPIHFTGSNRSRRWRRSRLEQYMKTQHDSMQQAQDILRWQEEDAVGQPVKRRKRA